MGNGGGVRWVGGERVCVCEEGKLRVGNKTQRGSNGRVRTWFAKYEICRPCSTNHRVFHDFNK